MAPDKETAERDRARAQEIRRVTWIGLWLNAGLCTCKIWAGFAGNSRAVVADGVHSFADLVTDIGLLAGLYFWKGPPDGVRPYADRRLESLVSFFMGAVLAVAAIGIAYNALANIGNGGGSPAGGPLALFAALLSVVSKEALYRWTKKKGMELDSDAVEANAWEHRTDAISSVPVACTVALAAWVPGLAFMDIVGALIISCFILYAAWKVCSNAVQSLVDGGNDPAVCGKLTEVAMSASGVSGVRVLRARYVVAQGLHADLHVDVETSLGSEQQEALARRLEDMLYSTSVGKLLGVDVFKVRIRLEPREPGGLDTDC